MPGMVVPLAADKVGAWETWIGELGGPRKAEFEDMNARHGLTEPVPSKLDRTCKHKHPADSDRS